MKFYILILVFIFTTSCRQAQEVVKYVNKEGRFEINFPTIPTIIKEDTTECGKEIPKTSFISKPSNNGNLEYRAHYFDLIESYTDTLMKKDIYTFLDRLQELNIEKANLLTMINLKLLGYVGKEYKWQDKTTQMFFRTRLYLVRNRVYIIYVSTAKDNNFNSGINNYFDSFKLLDTKINPKAEAENTEMQTKNFIADFPQTPEIKELEVESKYGIVKGTMYSCYDTKLLNDKNLFYVVSMMKYPIDITKIKDFNLENYYNETLDGSMKAVQSILISKNFIEIEGKKARQSKQSLKNGQIITKERTVLQGNTAYTIQVMTTPENDENIEMNKFIESFSLKSKP